MRYCHKMNGTEIEKNVNKKWFWIFQRKFKFSNGFMMNLEWNSLWMNCCSPIWREQNNLTTSRENIHSLKAIWPNRICAHASSISNENVWNSSVNIQVTFWFFTYRPICACIVITNLLFDSRYHAVCIFEWFSSANQILIEWYNCVCLK